MGGDTIQIIDLTPEELTPTWEEWLVDGLAKALPSVQLRGLFTVRTDLLREADLITVAVCRPAGEVAGVLSSQWVTLDDGVRFLHVTTQFVGERYRDGVVFRRSWAAHLAAVGAGHRGFPSIIVLKTYNPRVYSALRSFGRLTGASFYPGTDRDGSDTGIARLASRISRTISPECRFDPTTGVISGAVVPADLYPARSASANAAVNSFFARNTHPGDRVLCMLMMDTPQAVDAVMRHFTNVS
jgi:hypothetical protein